MDATIGQNTADFGDSACTGSDPVFIETPVSIELVTVNAAGADSAYEHVMTTLGDGTDLEANIVSFASRRRLGMADISVEDISVATFSPSPAPSSKPTLPLPTPLPTSAPGGSSSAGMDPMMLIMAGAGLLVLCVGILGIVCCMKLKSGSAPRPVQTVPGSGVEMSMPVVALPVTAVSGGPLADQVAKQQAASGQPVIMNLAAPQQAQKSSVAI